jgi:hypothetical protein
MAATPEKFIALAAKLIGGKFASFATPCVMTRSTGFDPDAQAETSETQTIPMIRSEFSERSIDGALVKVGDYQLLGEYQKMSWMPSADSTKTLHDGITCNVVRADTDPAKAVIILHVRRA